MWPLVKLGEVLSQPERSHKVDAAREYSLVGVRLDGQGAFLREKKLGSEISANVLNELKDGDFVYSRLFAWRGAFSVIDKTLDGCFVSNEFPIFRPVSERIDVRFLAYWFRLRDVLRTVEADCSGSTPLTRNRYKENFFLNLDIPLPPISEQRQIVAKIERLMTKLNQAYITRNQALLETEHLLQSTIGDVFESIASRTPLVSFGELNPHITSGPRNWSQYYTPEGYRFYRAQDIGPEGTIFDKEKQFLTPPQGNQGRNARLQAGDLMIVITGATVGRVAVFSEDKEPGFVSQHVSICRLPEDSIDPRYALWGLRGPIGQEQLLGQRYGQGKPGLNLTNISNLNIPLPSLNEQRRIVAYLDDFQNRIVCITDIQSQTQKELNALFPSILDKAFKGKL